MSLRMFDDPNVCNECKQPLEKGRNDVPTCPNCKCEGHYCEESPLIKHSNQMLCPECDIPTDSNHPYFPKFEPKSRPDHFYHGTVGSFKPGDLILPRNSTNAEANFAEDTDPNDKTGWNLGSVAYAVTGEDGAKVAEAYAKRVAEGTDKTPTVYRVEPVKPEDVESDIYGHLGAVSDAVKSASGFRVVGVHRSGVCRNCWELRDIQGKCECEDNSQ